MESSTQFDNLKLFIAPRSITVFSQIQNLNWKKEIEIINLLYVAKYTEI